MIVGFSRAGSGTYTASAVHFDGASLFSGSLTGVASPKYTFVSWAKSEYAAPTPPAQRQKLSFYLSNATAINSAQNGSSLWLASDDSLNTYCADGTFDNDFQDACPTSFDSTQWNIFLLSVDASTDPIAAVVQMYVGDAAQSATRLFTDGVNPIQCDFFSNLFCLPDFDQSTNMDVANPVVPPIQDMADWRLYVGTAFDWSIEANRRLVISALGKPVDPALLDGVLGAPAASLIGNAAAWISQATSQGLTLTGSLTDAPSSPSD